MPMCSAKCVSTSRSLGLSCFSPAFEVRCTDGQNKHCFIVQERSLTKGSVKNNLVTGELGNVGQQGGSHLAKLWGRGVSRRWPRGIQRQGERSGIAPACGDQGVEQKSSAGVSQSLSGFSSCSRGSTCSELTPSRILTPRHPKAFGIQYMTGNDA